MPHVNTNSLRRCSWSVLLFCLLTAAADANDDLPSVETVDAEVRSMWLIDGVVFDAETSKPIAEFTVTPGSLSTDDEGKSTIRWRANLKRDMKAGRLRWPRTSGFSVMRFKITAPGYVPAVTQRIWRGGPHTRIKIRLKPEQEKSPLE